MTSIVITAGILQSIFISLGVGSSTLAILNFFSAISDGNIDQTERRMMGIVYVILRVSMVGILFTTVTLLAPTIAEDASQLANVSIAQLIIIAVLFANAALMTMRKMPAKYGPGIQAGSWYTLGIIAALQLQGMVDYSVMDFIIGHVLVIVIAVVGVNVWMKRLA
ncbi:MAG: hypothetical protein ACI9SY_000106 [Candidatus Paceibacteria bacterium]|jgi:hypothetical protein